MNGYNFWLSLLFLYANAPLIGSNPLRAQIIIKEERDDKNHWHELLQHEDILKKYGLIFVDENPDVILCSWATKELLQTNIPIIILEINAAASIKNKTRKYLKYPQVKAVFKNRIFRDKTTYNDPHVQQTYFFSLVNECAHICQPTVYAPLSPQELDKIQLVIWDFNWSPFNKKKFSDLITCDVNFNNTERPTDIFFAGRLICNGKNLLQQFYNWHRAKAFEVIQNIPNITATILEGRALPFDQYIKAITTAKIVVSPWGWGEWCYRDFETILSGAILIKPDTSFVVSYPDIYKNYETYVPCKPDFSDLEEIITMILNNYTDYTQYSRNARALIHESWRDYDQLFAKFVQAITETLKEIS